MKKRLTALPLAAVMLLCGCTAEIDYSKVTLSPEYTEAPADPADDLDIKKDAMQETAILPMNFSKDTYRPAEYIVSPEEFSETVQAEAADNAETYTNSLEGWNGTGFISLSDHAYATIPVTVPSSQHYDITVRLCSNGAKAAVFTGGVREVDSPDGDYKTIDGTQWGAVYAGRGEGFEECKLKGVYLNKGENSVTIQALIGTAYIDEITVTNGSTVPKLAYEISNACVNPEASVTAKTVKRYLADVYGNRVLTGQFCSAGTNTEINAIYMSTGRYSAIRFADIGIFSEYYQGSDKNNEYELDTAINWWKSGGLVGYTWYWQSPMSDKQSTFRELTDFDLKRAVSETDASQMTPAMLEANYQTGRISSECVALINDMDAVAQQLKLLETTGVPVLFRPLPEAGNGWYWWGADSESYLWLYDLIFDRFTKYHQLTNLIWVWDGESPQFYPGDDKADIVGMDLYTNYDISGNARMLDAIGYTIKCKATALTECGRIPDPDIVARDNALWLWFALWKGDYIINPNGSIHYSHVSAAQLDRAYNNELYITRDELPDWERY